MFDLNFSLLVDNIYTVQHDFRDNGRFKGNGVQTQI